ncbi:MAG: hypothetical protein ACRELY_06975 [Polyangiaceae bacterium]
MTDDTISSNDDPPLDGSARDAFALDGSTLDARTDGGGGDTGAKVDADAAHDAGTPGPVTIRVLAFDGTQYVPASQGVVVFYDPDGTPQSPISLDATGVVTATVLPKSAVTVSTPYPGPPNSPPYDGSLFTYLGIEPGDDLTVDGMYNSRLIPVSNFATIEIENPTGDAGDPASLFLIGDHCQTMSTAGPPSKDIAAWDYCSFDGGINVLAMSEIDAKNAVAYAQGSVEQPADGGTTLSDWAWAPSIPTSLAISGTLPLTASQIQIRASLRMGAYCYLAHDDTTRAGDLLHGLANVADGGIQSPISMGFPGDGFIDNVAYETDIAYVGRSECTKIISINPIEEGLSLDATKVPPLIHDATISYDDASRTATADFVADGDIGQTQGVILEQSFGYGSHAYLWTIIAPPTSHIVVPALTSELVGGNYPSGAGALGPPQIRAVSADGLSSYSDFRASATSVGTLQITGRWRYDMLPAATTHIRYSSTTL